jgi:plasmid stabilization system protein ParE
MNLRLSPEAEQQAEDCDAWWRENRKDARDLFARELAATFAQLANTPKIGVVWNGVRGRPVRRFLMPRTRHHVYYELEASGGVIIHAIWGAPRERAPKL